MAVQPASNSAHPVFFWSLLKKYSYLCLHIVYDVYIYNIDRYLDIPCTILLA